MELTTFQSHLYLLKVSIAYHLMYHLPYFFVNKIICLGFVLLCKYGIMPVCQNVAVIIPQIERTMKPSSWRAPKFLTTQKGSSCYMGAAVVLHRHFGTAEPWIRPITGLATILTSSFLYFILANFSLIAKLKLGRKQGDERKRLFYEINLHHFIRMNSTEK